MYVFLGFAVINVSRKEFEKGWARARSVYTEVAAGAQRNNAHRLVLFYAVENGLKALIMRLERTRDGEADFSVEQHNLNKLLDRVRATTALRLERQIRIRNELSQSQRSCEVGDINQMWRYGCVADQPDDSQLESNLNKIALWIEEQLAA